MKILYLDCFSGLSGDMMLACLLDLGVPIAHVRQTLGKLALRGYRLEAGQGRDGALAGTELKVRLVPESEGPTLPGQGEAGAEGKLRVRARAQMARLAPVSRPEGTGSGERLGLEAGHTHSHAGGHTHSHAGGHTHSHAGGHTHSHSSGHAHSHADSSGHTHSHSSGHAHSHPHVHADISGGDGPASASIEAGGAAGSDHEAAEAAGHVHRSWAEIRELIGESGLSGGVKARALAVFGRLAEAEAHIHGMSVEAVSFHEVGAVDSVVDIVGAAIGLEYLGVERVECSSLPMGRGMVRCQHGLLPLPAPATLELLKGIPVYDAGREGELVTPTGAALVAALAEGFGGMPAMTVAKVGYGLGKRRGHLIPNAVRGVLGEVGAGRKVWREEGALVLEASVDDMSPQLFEPVMRRLLEEGALDVGLLPMQMKKGRPGQLVQVVCGEGAREGLVRVLLRETTSIGVRWYPVTRACLPRRFVEVKTAWGSARAKVSGPEGEAWNVMPELEDCRRLAEGAGVPLKRVQGEVLRRALEALEAAERG